MNVLVAGGAGYIGAHAVRILLRTGHEPVVVDNLHRGHAEALPPGVPFFHVDLFDKATIFSILRQHRIECVMHFAALAYVGESVEQPLRYYANNVAATISLLEAMIEARTPRMVFSSTCATYGEPSQVPITEETPQNPINPYGRSKLFVEHILRDCVHAYPHLGVVSLRYFNVAGCAEDGSCGEDHDPETHLIPRLLLAVLGRLDAVTIFGTDYPTPDGTCIRDYIHVEDLCEAHVVAMDACRPGEFRAYNLGIGRGYSVLEVVEAVRRVTGQEVPIRYGARRPGDPAVLFADASKIERELGWRPRFTTIEPIVETAWRWFRTHPYGYRSAPQAK
ncbi:MAG: UDP-glucose 4-epimerase GalE [Thermoguttaceae bacterium]|nr:UDP-glucose 4-epimerase GalE [Thermoguttaceae bacterium]MDW8077960.1 UDP-glucose 4-epimerase GalE [Thermoguttaceae bacterium]